MVLKTHMRHPDFVATARERQQATDFEVPICCSYDNLILTDDEAKVDCKRCLRMLATHNTGERS